MSLLSSDEARLKCEQMIGSAGSGLILSAFFTAPAAKWFLMQAPKVCRVVIRGKASDFVSGAASFEAIELLLRENHQVFFNFDLHAKIFYFGNEILLGSSNLTSNGLNLLQSGGNIELNNVIPASDDNVSVLERIVRSSINVDNALLVELRKHSAEAFNESIAGEAMWPTELFSSYSNTILWCGQLPQYNLENATSEDYEIWGAIARLQKEGNEKLASEKFKTTHIYEWLHNLLSSAADRGLSFGAVSSSLHSAIADDPTPGRKDIKFYQQNIYSFIESLSTDIEIIRPNFSQVLRLKGNNHISD